MNCSELAQDIHALRVHNQTLANAIETSNATGEQRNVLTDAKRQASQSTDVFLSRYFPDFAEHNPEIASGWENSGYIENFRKETSEYEFGFPNKITSINAMSDGRALIASSHAVYIYNLHGGQWQRGERIDALDGVENISTACCLPDGEILATSGASIYLCNKKDGKWQKVMLKKDQTEWQKHINTMQLAPNGDILVGCENGFFFMTKRPTGRFWRISSTEREDFEHIRHIATLPESTNVVMSGIHNFKNLLAVCTPSSGRWRVEQEIKIPKDETHIVNAISSIDDQILVAFGSNLYACRQDSSKGWQLNEVDKGDIDSKGISFIIPTPNHQTFLVGDYWGQINVCRQNEDGKWYYAEQIKAPDNRDSDSLAEKTLVHRTSVAAMTADGMRVIVGENNGEIYTLKRAKATHEDLKRNLPSIAAKLPPRP